MTLALLLCTLTAPAAHAIPAEIRSYAVVHDDGTLTVRGWRIRLFGVWLPPSDRRCDDGIRPIRCGTRAAGALRQRITGFVDCRPQFAYDDGSIAAVCRTGRVLSRPGVDLGAWLIQEGFALAAPRAPFNYRALERIAQSQGIGFWGRFVDDIR
jgi:endonuclease YncB( thermonuclease family)